MYLEAQLVRVSRNALLWAAVIIALLMFWLGHDWRNVTNAILGPFRITTADLVDERTLDRVSRFFVIVAPDGPGVEVGDEWTFPDGKGAQTARYVVMKCAGALLFVKQPMTPSRGQQTGLLTSIPADVATRVFNPTVSQASEAGLSVLPFMLDTTTDFKSMVIGWLVFGVVAGLLGLWWILVSVSRMSSVARHPVMIKLGQRYPSITAALSINQEIDAEYGAEGPRGVAMTTSWLVDPRHLRVGVYRLDELAWVYKKVTRHSTNFIPTGKTYAVVIHDRAGKVHEVQCGRSEEYANEMLAGIIERVPGIRAGYAG